ncbi:MAG: hypothetical protein ACSLFM_10685 [Tepidiformaceae bacterium]
MDEEGFADVVPREGDLFAGGVDAIGPEVADVPTAAKGGIDDRDLRVGGRGVQHAWTVDWRQRAMAMLSVQMRVAPSMRSLVR